MMDKVDLIATLESNAPSITWDCDKTVYFYNVKGSVTLEGGRTVSAGVQVWYARLTTEPGIKSAVLFILESIGRQLGQELTREG